MSTPIFGLKAWNETMAYQHLNLPLKELPVENLKYLFGYKYIDICQENLAL